MLSYQQEVDPFERILEVQNRFTHSKTLVDRKKLGQYFTSPNVSAYMASLIQKPSKASIRILDAGAGTGILTVNTALKCLDFGCLNVHATLYEIDTQVIPMLEETLKIVHELFQQSNATFTFEIFCEDFVLARTDKNHEFEQHDIAVINPPYFKYSALNSPYAGATSDLFSGDPNIYASFMAIVLSSLHKNGQMISISPRSFTNGLYFKGFRSYLLSNSNLNLIHIFKHRNKVFRSGSSQVLQENIICSFIKGEQQRDIEIRASDCDENIYNADTNSYPYNLIIDETSKQNIIRIPENSYQANILIQAEKLPTTFEDAGYFISTGRVVEHRTRDYITSEPVSINSVPLYRPHNITPPVAIWSGNHKKDVSFMIAENHEKHTLNNCTYVLLKRFSSKDEKRRLVAGIHFAEKHSSKYIGFGNKTNYIGLKNEILSQVEAFGLVAIFNSTFMDRYFRCISGNTQVNATEIRIMKFPSRKQVIEIGKKFRKLTNFKITEIDKVVNSILGIQDII